MPLATGPAGHRACHSGRFATSRDMRNATSHDKAGPVPDPDTQVYAAAGQATALPVGAVPIPLSAVPDLPPDLLPRRAGQRIHRSRVYAWVKHGRRGVRLKAIRGVGGLYTCESWVREFCEALTGNPGPAPAAVRSPGRRRRQFEQAEAALDRAGIR